MLSDNYLNLLFQKIINIEPDIKFVIFSGKKNLIKKYLDKYETNQEPIDKKVLKEIFLLDDLDLLNKLIIPKKYLQELIVWTEENDLLEINKYLQLINSH